MKKLLVAAIAAVSLYVAPASAQAQTIDWSGGYAGLNVGYGWSNNSFRQGGDPNFFGPISVRGDLQNRDISPSGIIGGAQAGYNAQSGRIVYGIEVGIDRLGMSDKQTHAFTNFFRVNTTERQNISWLGTLRGRLGFTLNSKSIIFVTGGLAVGGTSASFNMDVPGLCPLDNLFCSKGSKKQTRVGPVIGGGIESMLGKNWSVKFEYLYFDLGTANFAIHSTVETPAGSGSGSATFKGQLARVGLNYRF